MIQYKFTNGVLISMTFLNASYTYEVDGVEIDPETVEIANDSAFFKGANEVRLYEYETKPSVARLVDQSNEMLNKEISLDLYHELTNEVKDLYELTDEVKHKIEVPYKLIELDFNYLDKDKIIHHCFKVEKDIEVEYSIPERFNQRRIVKYTINDSSPLRSYVPATIRGSNLAEAIALYIRNTYDVTDDIMNGEARYELSSYGNRVSVTAYRSAYNGEKEQVEVMKANGMPYATPRYKMKAKRPEELWRRTLEIPYKLVIAGDNSFDLENKINKIVKSLME